MTSPRIAGLLALGWSPTALASGIPEDLHLDLLGGTTLPIEVGGRVQLEVPHRLRVGLHAGWLPPPYVDLYNEVSTSAGWYDDVTAALIAASIEDALVLGVDVGWRPLPRHGFFFGAGYQVAALGGALTGSEVIEAVTGTDVPDDRGGAAQVDAAATVHFVTVDLGWEQVWLDRIVLRVALGGSFTVGSRSRLTTDVGRGGPAIEGLLDGGEAYLDDVFTSYVHTPTIAVHLGYRFF